MKSLQNKVFFKIFKSLSKILKCFQSSILHKTCLIVKVVRKHIHMCTFCQMDICTSTCTDVLILVIGYPIQFQDQLNFILQYSYVNCWVPPCIAATTIYLHFSNILVCDHNCTYQSSSIHCTECIKVKVFPTTNVRVSTNACEQTKSRLGFLKQNQLSIYISH